MLLAVFLIILETSQSGLKVNALVLHAMEDLLTSTVISLYRGHPRDHELVSYYQESVIAEIYFSQTSVIYFCQGLVAIHIIRVSVIARCPEGES